MTTQEKQIFDNVGELLETIDEGDTRTPFVVTHRKVDYYVLAEDDVEALATVFAEKSGAVVANVPVSEIISALKPKKKTTPKKPAAKPTAAKSTDEKKTDEKKDDAPAK